MDGLGKERTRRITGLLLALGLVTAVVVISLGGILPIAGWVDRNPDFCTQCHVAQNQYELWPACGHRDVACQECHRLTREQATSILLAFAFRESGGSAPLHEAPVADGACALCHVGADAGRGPQIGGSSGHEVHVTREGTSCIACHGRSIHGLGTALDSCRVCHESQAIRAEGMGDLHCLACHDFLGHDESLTPPRQACLECHRSSGMPDLEFPANAHMATFDCARCHRPHEERAPTIAACSECHDRIERHGLHSVPGHRECRDCHRAHAFTATAASCQDCHPAGDRCESDCLRCHPMRLPEGERP